MGSRWCGCPGVCIIQRDTSSKDFEKVSGISASPFYLGSTPFAIASCVYCTNLLRQAVTSLIDNRSSCIFRALGQSGGAANVVLTDTAQLPHCSSNMQLGVEKSAVTFNVIELMGGVSRFARIVVQTRM